jgi:hypothetical protein
MPAACLQSPLASIAGIDREVLPIRVLLFVTCFLIGTLFTFIGRRYLHGPEDQRREEREKVRGEIIEALDKLRRLN